MKQVNIQVTNTRGIHCRPAGEIVNCAMKFDCEIYITKEDDTEKINAKSLIEILTLGLHKNDTVTITANGTDEDKAIKSIVDIISRQFAFD